MNRTILWVCVGAVVLIVALALCSPPAEAQPTACMGIDVNDPRATEEADYLIGTTERDVIALGFGADQYGAWEGPDIVCGNAGADVLFGEDGADTLNGGDEGDIIAGHAGADIVLGGDGPDVLKGNAGDDFIRDGMDTESDELWDGVGSDVIVGGPEDRWCKAEDGEPDDHDLFQGVTVPDEAC